MGTDDLVKGETTDASSQRLHANRHRQDCACGFCARIRANYARSLEKRKLPRPRRWNAKKESFLQEFTDIESPGFNNAGKAAELSDLSPSRGRQMMHEPQMRSAIVEAFEKKGVTKEFIADRVRDGMLADEVRYFTHNGEIFAERRDPDHHSRHRFTELAMRARGDFPKDEPVQLASLILKIGSGPATPEEWEVIAEQERRVSEILAKRLEDESYPADPDEYGRWRIEAKAKVRAELQAAKASE